MSIANNHIDPFESLNPMDEEYRKDLSIRENELQNIFHDSLAKVGCSMAPQHYQRLLRENVTELGNFANPNKSVEKLENSLTEVEELIQKFTLNAEKTKVAFEPIRKCSQEILKSFRIACDAVNGRISDAFQRIEQSGHGRMEYGKEFEQAVIEFLDNIFLHEMTRTIPPKWANRKIDLDAYYETLKGFDSMVRVGFDFKRLIVECKNKAPSTNDLMQCFKYTLYFQDIAASKVPLALLISRFAPGKSSPIWELLKRIIQRKIENETRLILIIGIQDLKAMRDAKLRGDDAASIIKQKIVSLAWISTAITYPNRC